MRNETMRLLEKKDVQNEIKHRSRIYTMVFELTIICNLRNLFPITPKTNGWGNESLPHPIQ